jgi:hypothetical protein
MKKFFGGFVKQLCFLFPSGCKHVVMNSGQTDESSKVKKIDF